MNKTLAIKVIERAAKRANVSLIDTKLEGNHLKMILRADNDRPAQIGMLYSYHRLSEKQVELYTMRFAKHWCHGENYQWGGWGESIR